jgi:agarase
VHRTPNLGEFYRFTHRPIMVAEYSFRAADAGVPNSWPPIFPIYATQQDRADAYAAYVETLHRAPWMVGDFWFEYTDEPAGGRFDHEDSNFGVVATTVPWQTLVDRMTVVHAQSPDRQEP